MSFSKRAAIGKATSIVPQNDSDDKQRPSKRYRRPGVSRYQVKLPDDYVELLDELEGARSHHIEESIKRYLVDVGKLGTVEYWTEKAYEIADSIDNPLLARATFLDALDAAKRKGELKDEGVYRLAEELF